MKTENTIKKSGLGARASRRLSNTIVYIILIAVTVIWLFPFFGLVMESFKVNTKAMDGELIPEKFGFDPVNDVQVLTPMNRGSCGTVNINDILSSLEEGAFLLYKLTNPFCLDSSRNDHNMLYLYGI